MSTCICFAISMKISILIDIYTGGTTVEVRDVTGTEANVQGLTPGALYTFSVTSENAVSSQDIDITGRSTNATATTEEGGKAAHECKLMAYIQQERSKQGPTNNKRKATQLTCTCLVLSSFFISPKCI